MALCPSSCILDELPGHSYLVGPNSIAYGESFVEYRARILKPFPGKLYFASLLGFDFSLKELLKKEMYITRGGGKYGSAIAAAGACSHIKALNLLLHAFQRVDLEDIITIIRYIKKDFLDTFLLLQEFPIQQPRQVVSQEVSDHFPAGVPAIDILRATMYNKMAGPKLLKFLLDTYPSISITVDELEQLAAFEDIQQEVLVVLFESLENRQTGIPLTKSVMQAACKNARNGEWLIRFFLDNYCAQVLHLFGNFTTDMALAAARNYHCGDKIMTVLLENLHSNNIVLSDSITEHILLAAARNRECGDKIMTSLLQNLHANASPLSDSITRDVMLAAAGNSVCGESIICVLWDYCHVNPRSTTSILSEANIVKAFVENHDVFDHLLGPCRLSKHLVYVVINEPSSAQSMARVLEEMYLSLITHTIETIARSHSERAGSIMRNFLAKPETLQFVTEDILKLVASNNVAGRYLMEAIVIHCGPSLAITPDFIRKLNGNKEQGTAILDVLVEHRVSLPITKDLVEILASESGYTVDPKRLMSISNNSSEITPEAFIEIFRNRKFDSFPLITLVWNSKFSIPFNEDLIRAAAEVSTRNPHSGDVMIVVLILTRHAELAVTGAVVNLIAEFLLAKVMRTLLGKCKDVPITEKTRQAARRNIRDRGNMMRVVGRVCTCI